MPIRRARLDDHAAIASLLDEVDTLHAELLPSYFRRPRGAPRPPEELARILTAFDEAIFVSEEPQGAVVGFVHVQLYDTPPVAVMVPRRRAHVDNVVVTRAARRRGHGRRLMEAAAAWAREHGAEEILLTVWAGNEAAERFYAALGFGRVNCVLARPL